MTDGNVTGDRVAMMMATVSNRMIQDWAARLDELGRIEAASRELSCIAGWRVAIHIRILRYLLSRYGEFPPDQHERVDRDEPVRDKEGDLVQTMWPAGVSIPREFVDVSTHGAPGIETMAFDVPAPPRRGSVMKPTLCRIRETNIDLHPMREPGRAESAMWYWWEHDFARRFD